MIAPLLAVLAAAALVAAYVTDSRTLAGVGFALAVVGGVMALAVWLLEPASGATQVADEQSDDEQSDDEPVVEPEVEEPIGEEPIVEERVVEEPMAEDDLEPEVLDEPEPEAPAADPVVVDVEPAAVEDPVSTPATVWVITGRKRYHLRECPLLGQRPAEELSIEAARESGLSPCSACAQ